MKLVWIGKATDFCNLIYKDIENQGGLPPIRFFGGLLATPYCRIFMNITSEANEIS